MDRLFLLVSVHCCVQQIGFRCWFPRYRISWHISRNHCLGSYPTHIPYHNLARVREGGDTIPWWISSHGFAYLLGYWCLVYCLYLILQLSLFIAPLPRYPPLLLNWSHCHYSIWHHIMLFIFVYLSAIIVWWYYPWFSGTEPSPEPKIEVIKEGPPVEGVECRQHSLSHQARHPTAFMIILWKQFLILLWLFCSRPMFLGWPL